jgi:threonine dehydratase
MEGVMESVTISDIQRAALRISKYIVRTPLLQSPLLNEQVGASTYVKAESLQRTGAFKIRGALNKLLLMNEDTRANGVVAFSAGNHGLGVAAAAKITGCRSIILLPKTAARTKIESCQWWASEVLFYDPQTEDREVVGRSIAELKGMTLIQPFDDDDIIAGQGTLGLELCEQLKEQGAHPDSALVSCSGGGLAAGVSVAMTHIFPAAQMFVVEPQGYEKMGRSLRSGKPERNSSVPDSIMDAIIGPRAGSRTLPILRSRNVRGLSVSDEEALYAMAVAFGTLKLVVEPGGAAGLAALIAEKADFSGQTVAVICSGGNVDRNLYIRALEHGHSPRLGRLDAPEPDSFPGKLPI